MDAFQTQRNHWLNKATVCDTAFAPPAESGGSFYAQLMTLHHLQQTADPRPRLQGNQTPLLLFRGQCDNQPWGVVPDYLGPFTNARLENVPGAGHVIATEQAAEYARRLGEFLEEDLP
jgi:pimeloyl-ACP methyl ester carboxylesterase